MENSYFKLRIIKFLWMYLLIFLAFLPNYFIDRNHYIVFIMIVVAGDLILKKVKNNYTNPITLIPILKRLPEYNRELNKKRKGLYGTYNFIALFMLVFFFDFTKGEPYSWDFIWIIAAMLIGTIGVLSTQKQT